MVIPQSTTLCTYCHRSERACNTKPCLGKKRLSSDDQIRHEHAATSTYDRAHELWPNIDWDKRNVFPLCAHIGDTTPAWLICSHPNGAGVRHCAMLFIGVPGGEVLLEVIEQKS